MIYKDEVYNIIGAAMSVHSELGYGFLEPVYQEALEIEFQIREIPFEREKQLPVFYKNYLLDKKYFADFICYDKIIVELKATSGIISEHISQTINYLNATKNRLGLIINFGEKSLTYQRIIL